MSIETAKRLWLHKKVISISNGFQADLDDISLHKGEVVDIIPIGQSEDPFPMVLFEGEKEPMLSFSTLIEYDEELWQALVPLTAEIRWKLIQAFCYRYSATVRL